MKNSNLLYINFYGGKNHLDNFVIELLAQNWIDNKPDNSEDLCSHGKVLLKINDIVLSDENSGEWTVASSALRLMKSAIYGYDSKSDLQLLPCCGYLRLFPSCPNYITWDVTIIEDIVFISNIQCSKNEKNGLKIIDHNFQINFMDYASQILDFADKVIKFYSLSLTRKFYDKFDEEDYQLFWKEFNEYYQTLKEKCAK